MLLKIPFLYSVQNYQSAFEFPNQQNVTLYTVWWIFFGWLSFFFFFGWKRDFTLKFSVILKKADQTLGLNLGSGADTLAVRRHLSTRGTSLAARYLLGCAVGRALPATLLVPSRSLAGRWSRRDVAGAL